VQPFACPRTLLCDRTSVDGQYGDPFNCSRFYLCIDGQSFSFNCPVGMSWSERAGYCDRTERADCDLRVLQRYDLEMFRVLRIRVRVRIRVPISSYTSLVWFSSQHQLWHAVQKSASRVSGSRKLVRCIPLPASVSVAGLLTFSHIQSFRVRNCRSWLSRIMYAKVFGFLGTVFTALHVMQTRYCDENSVRLSVRPTVCPSVRLSHACIVTKRKKDLSRFIYHTKEHLA